MKARADVQGVVVAVQVQLGDAVQAGQVLALLESMKMEVPVLAPAAGDSVEPAAAYAAFRGRAARLEPMLNKRGLLEPA